MAGVSVHAWSGLRASLWGERLEKEMHRIGFRQLINYARLLVAETASRVR